MPNPFFVDDLRPHSGADAVVADWVLEKKDATQFLGHVHEMLTFLLPRFEQEGKAYLTIAVGCTGGRHRSPAIAHALGQRLRAHGVDVRVVHRDIDHKT